MAVIGRALPHRVLDPCHGVAGCFRRHDERRNALLAHRRVGHREDQGDVGAAAGGNELLGAVQDELVADPLGARRDRRGIGAGARFGEAEGAQKFAAGEWTQEAFLLLRRAVPQERQADQRVVYLERRRRRAVRCRDIHDGEGIGDIVGAGAVELRRHGQAQHAELTHAGEGLAREAWDPVSFGGRRRQFPGRELAGHVADLPLAFGQHGRRLGAGRWPVLAKVGRAGYFQPWLAAILTIRPSTGGTGTSPGSA
ncbi:hypothetical protein SAMN02990966_06795 [Rhodospirillales bacterium URHD0017]|nr:hypothetical protein SAMN02990966_06795 [Rhodospirillales bacterium URHD0017]